MFLSAKTLVWSRIINTYRIAQLSIKSFLGHPLKNGGNPIERIIIKQQNVNSQFLHYFKYIKILEHQF